MNDENLKYLFHELRNAIHIDQYNPEPICTQTVLNYADAVYLNGSYNKIFAGINSDIIVIDHLCQGIAGLLWLAYAHNIEIILIKDYVVKFAKILPIKYLDNFQPIIYLKSQGFKFKFYSSIDIGCSL